MRLRWPVLALCLIGLAPPLCADDPKPGGKQAAGLKTYQVPYRLTDTQHVMVRVKLNGKGPYNFIVDTGAPLLYVTVPVAKKVGLKPAEKDAAKEKKGGYAVTLDRFEIEGGIAHEKIKCLVDTPFQLKGMNAMGMAGEELHGILGYTVLAHYRMQFDFTKNKLPWTRLDFTPPAPVPLGIKGDDPTGMDKLGGFMEAMAILMGKGKRQPPELRGFLGIELAEQDGAVLVKSVLPEGPAARAGVKAGDRIQEIQGKAVTRTSEVLGAAAKVTAGTAVRLTVKRGGDMQEITVTSGEGL
jgi:hypothetical protein